VSTAKLSISFFFKTFCVLSCGVDDIEKQEKQGNLKGLRHAIGWPKFGVKFIDCNPCQSSPLSPLSSFSLI